MRIKENIKSIIGIILIIVLFILASYIVKNNLDFFKNYIKDDFVGMIIYVLILIVSIILAPINEIILVPIATALWGWFIAALLTLLGWVIGASIAFILGRRYGVPLIRKILPLKEIYKYQEFISKENTFVGIIFLRIAIPIDVISYAIGIFTNVNLTHYFFATLIGFLPLAFFLAYLGTLPAHMQITGFILFLLIVIIGFLSVKHKPIKKIKKAS
jgi:uncharacterized membrane protein YdjX (TVP38/TMEM64 family)